MRNNASSHFSRRSIFDSPSFHQFKYRVWRSSIYQIEKDRRFLPRSMLIPVAVSVEGFHTEVPGAWRMRFTSPRAITSRTLRSEVGGRARGALANVNVTNGGQKRTSKTATWPLVTSPSSIRETPRGMSWRLLRRLFLLPRRFSPIAKNYFAAGENPATDDPVSSKRIVHFCLWRKCARMWVECRERKLTKES